MELNTIEMQGDKIPILCTMWVLEELQAEFGSVKEFSDKLTPQYDTEGKLIPGWMPDIHAVVYALPKFIDEGIEVYNLNHKIKIDKMTPKQIFQRCDQPLLSVSIALYRELWRSINAPKSQPLTEVSK